MNNKKNDPLTLLDFKSIKIERKIDITSLMGNLDELQDLNNYIMDIVKKQNEALESVIEKLINAGVL